jgi:hypothetical protein
MAPYEDAVVSDALRPSETAIRKMSVTNPDLNHLLSEAKDATKAEKDMTIIQAFRTYPKAVMFSMILSTAIIMEGFVLASFGFKTSTPFRGGTGDPYLCFESCRCFA